MGQVWPPSDKPVPARIWPWVLAALCCVGAPLLVAAIVIATVR